jgi:hypothetical protein
MLVSSVAEEHDMQPTESIATSSTGPTPWNKGKLIGPKPPLRAKHVWSIRTKLQMDGQTRDLACSTSLSTVNCASEMSSR